MNKVINVLYCVVSFLFILLFTVASIYHSYVLFNLLTAILIIIIRPIYYLLRNKLNIIHNNIILLIAISCNLCGMFILYKGISNGITLVTNNISIMLLTVLSIIILFTINKIIYKSNFETKKSKANLNMIILLSLIILNVVYVFYNNDILPTAISIATSLFFVYILITYNNYDSDKKMNILIFIILVNIIELNFISSALSLILLKNFQDEKNRETIDIFNTINNKTKIHK